MSTYSENKEWREQNPDKWNQQKKRYYAKFRRNTPNRGQRYTIQEINLILNSELSDRELHRLLGRSIQAIQVQRCKLLKDRIQTG